MQVDAHYLDPRLVELYDTDNPSGVDTEFYLRLAQTVRAKRVVDLGCGTGLLTRKIAMPGREVIGVDPSPAMLAYARNQPGAERVHWIEGDVKSLGIIGVDYAVMTGNVAQIFVEDRQWEETLVRLRESLRPSGVLAFETRNPDARVWEEWTREGTYEQINSNHGPLERWIDLVDARPGAIRFTSHNVFIRTGENIIAECELRFRSLQEVENSLKAAGLDVVNVYGDWNESPLRPASNVMVFVARRS